MKILKKIRVAIDSPAAAGAGTQAKLISKHYKLLYLDTGKIYRLLGYYKINNSKRFNSSFIIKKMKNIKITDLKGKKLLTNEVGIAASIIAKNKKIRKQVHNFQIKCAYFPPRKYNGSCLDGRDITYKIIPDANFKFFITASLKVRAIRRYRELRKLGKKTTLKDVKKSIKIRDYSDYNRRISPLKRTKDSILINTSNLTKSACFLKIKNIIEKETKN